MRTPLSFAIALLLATGWAQPAPGQGLQGLKGKTLQLYNGEALQPASVDIMRREGQYTTLLLDGQERSILEVKYIEEGQARLRVEAASSTEDDFQLYRRVLNGKRIDLYATTSYVPDQYPKRSLTEIRRLFFEKEEGTLFPIKYRQLKLAMQDDNRSLEVLKKANRWRMLDFLCIAIGLGGAAVLANQSFSTNSAPSSLFIPITAITMVPLATRAYKQNIYQEAIEVYNR